MGKLGTIEIVILLMVIVLVVVVPFICYRLGYKAGRVRWERDELQRQVGQQGK
jgi:cell division protein FtsL